MDLGEKNNNKLTVMEELKNRWNELKNKHGEHEAQIRKLGLIIKEAQLNYELCEAKLQAAKSNRLADYIKNGDSGNLEQTILKSKNDLERYSDIINLAKNQIMQIYDELKPIVEREHRAAFKYAKLSLEILIDKFDEQLKTLTPFLTDIVNHCNAFHKLSGDFGLPFISHVRDHFKKYELPNFIPAFNGDCIFNLRKTSGTGFIKNNISPDVEIIVQSINDKNTIKIQNNRMVDSPEVINPYQSKNDVTIGYSSKFDPIPHQTQLD